MIQFIHLCLQTESCMFSKKKQLTQCTAFRISLISNFSEHKCQGNQMGRRGADGRDKDGPKNSNNQKFAIERAQRRPKLMAQKCWRRILQ